MNRRSFLAAGAAGLAACSGFPRWTAGTRRPAGLILILVDDLGWTDLGCYGSPFYQTPHIDRLCRNGMKFTNAYSACTVCSPTRASILTGKYPARLHLTDWIPGERHENDRLLTPPFNQRLPLEETTLAEVLKKNGYVSASIGKWHLGDEPFYPEKQGFDLNVGGTLKGQPPAYFAPYRIPTLTEGPPGEYLTDRLAAEAVHFLQQHHRSPFFLYWPHFAVHTPLQAPPELEEKYGKKVKANTKQKNARYAAMIESLDQAVGKLTSALEDLTLLQDTVIVFASDNGGLLRSTDNSPLRAGKGSAYEGGVRVPFIVHYPALIKSGYTCDVPAISMDIFPALLTLAGCHEIPENDGCDLTPLLSGAGSALPRTALYWHYPHYHGGGATPHSAIRKGNYRLIEFLEDERVELYDLSQDAGDTEDLAEKFTEKRKELLEELQQWRVHVKASMPRPNPAYQKHPNLPHSSNHKN